MLLVTKLISSISYAVRLVLFYGVVRHLPDSTVPGGQLWRILRYAVRRKLFLDCGENVNIERGAHIGRGRSISIGLIPES
jgi:maltose O-acetyltransferase